MVELAQWDEKTLPDSRKVWDWNKGADPFELWIFFFKRDAAGLDEIRSSGRSDGKLDVKREGIGSANT